MKKFIFILVIFFTLSVMSGGLFAKTETKYYKAIQYYNSGKYREAVEIFKDYIQTKPEAPAYYRIGYALYKIGEYDKANYYFKQAYLIDPSFSPEIIAPTPKGIKISQPPVKQVPSVPVTQPEIPPSTVTKPQPQIQMKPQKEVLTPKEEAPPKEKQVVTPRRRQPPAGLPKFPEPKEGIPYEIPALGTNLMAGLGMISIVLQIVNLALFIFFLLCLYFIAKKLEVPTPWLAFIPIINIWTIVNCAGKPWWWILLLLIPLVNIIIGIIIWMSITENLGKNKWLGLLMLVPLVNFIFLAILAFSKTEGAGTAEGITTA